MHQFSYMLSLSLEKAFKDVQELKENAKRILMRIEEGEDVVMTVVHLSEVANILETHLSRTKSVEYIKAILAKPTIHVYDVDVASYAGAVLMTEKYMIDINDGLALVYMERLGVKAK